MPSATWTQLVKGHEHRRVLETRHELPDHRPIAAVLGCSDARVSPTVLFGQPAGALFEVRVIGNTTDSACVASLDFAVTRLHVGLVIVLGHTDCGAVNAAIEREVSTRSAHPSVTAESDDIAVTIEPIARIVDDQPWADAEAIVHRNVMRVVTELNERFRARSQSVTVRGAVHDLESGRLLSATMVQR